MSLNDFKIGIFALKTRRFGSVAEIMIKKLYKLSEARSLQYDKYDSKNDKRIEIKFSTVLKRNNRAITEANVIAECLNANLSNRIINYADRAKNKFDCNIQQVKCNEFDVLYYGLFFADKILIFKMSSLQVKSCPGYSNKQHYGNEGEGQFHITNDNLKYHTEHYLEKELNYKELYNLLK